ncbi:uncharacterized protein LOC111692490 [Anoplophora glabripennis]|uniref:uncharacterized protein LOC111692490 n=1 Tax=Anoplophora glabripennis TaxID=217634 RepID=UPI000C77B975|nr:uncharacterized protein LOC111692490 [Anoplophora glabripennis]
MDESIQKVEWRTYYPYVKSFRNNDVIEIIINQADVFDATYDGQILISGKITKVGNGGVSFVNNAAAFMFSSATYEINAKELKSIREVGLVSTVRGYLSYSAEDSKHLSIAGWNYPNVATLNADGTFNFLIPLRDEEINLFNDYRVVTCSKQCIKLIRASNDSNCFLVKEKVTTDKTTVTPDIQNIEVKIKRLYPNDEIKLSLLKAIKADTPILIPYRQWDLHMLPALTAGATKEIWAVKTTSAIESPRYIIVGFQTAKQNKFTADPTHFDNIDITNIRLTLNSESFPNERMRLNFTKNDYAEAHYNYTEFYPSYSNTLQKKSLLDYDTFKNHAFFVIDCSRRDESMKSSTVDVRLDIEAAQGFPDNTSAYCIIVHDCIMEHYPLSEIVKNLA